MRSAFLIAALAACSAPPRRAPAPPPAPRATAYHATVRWTSDGVPHVTADDWGSLGFGQGWAQAALHLCEVEDQVVRVRGERSKFFGPGDGDANLDSDFFHLHMGYLAHARAAIDAVTPDARAMAHGFVLGFDQWLARTPTARRPAACRDAAWVRPITDDDVAAMGLAIATTASSRALAPLVARAAPRDGKAARLALPDTRDALASNAWGVGGDRTASGGGLVLANPHFPWEGDLQFYESQLTIPGRFDVYGAALLGTPGIEIGFNARVAWTHTFSSSVHFVIYRVPLAPDQPLRVALGDNPEPIVPATYTIAVKQPDGSLKDATRTLYRTRWGPMIDSAELPWDPAKGFAFTLDDVALDDGAALDEYLAFGRARSIDDVAAALRASHTPFVNTIAADAAGDALYVDGSRVPALSDEGLMAWTLGRASMPALEQAWQKGVVVLDAAMPQFALAGDSRGAIPIDRAPRLRRRDFVVNANGPYRFTHPGVAMDDASPLYGDAPSPSARTLANWALLAGDARLDRKAAAQLLFSNRSYTGEAMLDDVLRACPRKPPTLPCIVLAHWDRRFALASQGAALWREFLREIAPDGVLPWAHPYDPNDPTTPRGLALDGKAIRVALDAAARRLDAKGVDPGTALAGVQTAKSDQGDRVGVPGGQQLDGVANVVMWNPGFNGTLLPKDDGGGAPYPVDFGTSFVMAVDLTKDGPHADVLLTYGNSSDPASPHYRDGLAAFRDGTLRPARYTDADQRADPALQTDDLRYTEPAP